MANQAVVSTTPDRRERFRSFLRRFNPSAPAKSIIGQGLICNEMGYSIAEKLVAGVDLAPGNQQLVIGGIGSGKTTELLLAERRFAETTQMLPLYIDVSADTDLTAVTSGSLLTSLGLRAWKEVDKKTGASSRFQNAFRIIKEAADGYYTQVLTPSYLSALTELGFKTREEMEDWQKSHERIKVPDKLKPPLSSLQSDIRPLAEAVSEILSVFKSEDIEVVVIFDGLDRLIKPDQFWSVSEQDLRALKIQNISIIIAGPLSLMYGQDRQITDYFDQFYHLPAAPTDPKVSSFLFDILQKRQIEDFIKDPNQVRRLCRASGGVLRDLISLARSAGENAYLDNSDYVQPLHVDKAITQLRNNYLLGLSTEQIRILDDFLTYRRISPSNPETMELLITRRILERSGGGYDVHPALEPVVPNVSSLPRLPPFPL
jgi:Cdc6-like AAA superfamily ATPase